MVHVTGTTQKAPKAVPDNARRRIYVSGWGICDSCSNCHVFIRVSCWRMGEGCIPMTPARQPQECKTCIHDGKFETQCCVMSGHYYNVCAISKIQVIEGKPIIRCSTHTSAQAQDKPRPPCEECIYQAQAAAAAEAAKATREQILTALERDFKGRYVDATVTEIRRFPESLRQQESKPAKAEAPPAAGRSERVMTEQQRLPKEGDIIQTGMIYANGDGSIHWGTHQIVRRISSDGTLWFRPREAKVDKCSSHWRFPIGNTEEIIVELKHWANPQETKVAIAQLRALGHPSTRGGAR